MYYDYFLNFSLFYILICFFVSIFLYFNKNNYSVQGSFFSIFFITVFGLLFAIILSINKFHLLASIGKGVDDGF